MEEAPRSKTVKRCVLVAILKKVLSMGIHEDIAGRDWQQNALTAFDNFVYRDEDDVYLTVACPGAGKTRFSVAAMRVAVETPTDKPVLIVVVAPTETVRIQWVDEAASHGIMLHHYMSEDLRDAAFDGFEEKIHGIVTTYQQVAIIADVFTAFCNMFSVLLVADEVHHCADHLTWGDKLIIGFTGAWKKLVLSGTPFRTDEGRIPFIMRTTEQGGWEVREPDASYFYEEACNDRVCRVIYFPRVNARIRFEDDGGVYTHALDEADLGTGFRNRMYNAALDTDRSDFSRYLLEQAWAKVSSLRANEQPDAALLVIARDNRHAAQIAVIMHAITGKKPVVVNTDTPDSSSKIKRFRKGKAPVIVAVKMFSEGVDAPRIRVIAFLTRAKTAMWFRQIVGRAVRWQDSVLGDQPAFMFIPAIPEFDTMAREIEKEIQYVIDAQEGPGRQTWACDACGHDNPMDVVICEECGAEKPRRDTPPPPPPVITVHGSSDEAMAGFIGMGIDFSQEFIDMAGELIDEDVLIRRMQPEHVAMVIRAASANPAWAKRFQEFYSQPRGGCDVEFDQVDAGTD